MTLALSHLLGTPKVLEWISKYGTDDDILTPDIPEPDRVLLDKYGWSRLPNIVSCYEEDLEALGNLLNDKTPDIDAPPSYLYDAFVTVKEIIAEGLPDDSQRRDFLRYLHNDVKVLRISITEWRFTLRVFNSFNNIKVSVPPSYLLKKAFTTARGVSRSAEIHAVFCELKRPDFEQFIHNVTNMYLRTLLNYKDYERTVGGLITPTTDGTCALARFRAVAARLDNVTDFLKGDPYGRILLTGLSRGYEVMNLCLRPIGFVALETGDIASFQKVLRALCAYSIRRQVPVNFNQIAYQNTLKPLMDSLLSGAFRLSDAVTALHTHLVSWLGIGTRNSEVTLLV